MYFFISFVKLFLINHLLLITFMTNFFKLKSCLLAFGVSALVFLSCEDSIIKDDVLPENKELNDIDSLLEKDSILLDSIQKLDSITAQDSILLDSIENLNLNNLVNAFVWKKLDTFYLWHEQLPSTFPTLGLKPNEFFDLVKYKEEDRWSLLVENSQELKDELDGVVTSSGYLPRLIRLSDNSNDIIAIITHVYPNSSASRQGLKRGDVITKVNGTTLNTSNYRDLLFSTESFSISLAKIINKTLVETGVTKNITKTVLQTNPVAQHHVREKDGKKVAYLNYLGFINEYDNDLVNALATLQAEGADELILDLRYNGGGDVSTAIKLASILAPSSAIGKPFIKKIWNNHLGQAFREVYGTNHRLLVENLQQESINLNLSRLYVITASGTASASELIINGLRPYMEVITVGTTTHGKYTASTVFTEDEKHDWALMPIIFKSANANGVTDYGDGFKPTIEVQDDYLAPLGSLEEDCYRKAWNSIFNIRDIPAREESLFIPVEEAEDGRNPRIRYEMFDNSLESVLK